jgi:TRAP-type C4-dicarboxylate transport system permease small subunit
MRLNADWRRIARKAWSIRLGIAAAFLSGGEIILPLFVDSFPRNVFAVLSFVTVVAAVLARLIAQKDLN